MTSAPTLPRTARADSLAAALVLVAALAAPDVRARPTIHGPSTVPAEETAADDVGLHVVAPDLWRLPGRGGQPDASNGGRTQNAWLLRLGARSLLVDPGPDPARTARIARAAQAMSAPLAWVLDTHPHPEAVLGNAGAPGSAQVLASREADRLMRERCPECSRRFVEAIGVRALARTPLRHADRPLDEGPLRLGPTDFVAIDVGRTHSDADLVLFEPARGLLFAGGVAGCDSLPALSVDATPERWIAALARLRALPVRWLAGGEGGLCDAQPALARAQAYLEGLRDGLAALIAEGATAAGIESRVPPADALARADPLRHAQNVQRAFRAMEDASFETPAPASR